MGIPADNSAWIPLLFIFFILYGRFIVLYGFQYMNIANVDLPSFYAASVIVFNNHASPYIPVNLQFVPYQYVFPWLYPPPSLLLFFPLSALTYRNACLALLVLNQILIVLLVWVIPLYLLRLSPQQHFPSFALCIALTLTFHPCVVTLNHGQVNIILLVLLLFFWLLARRKLAILAGFCLAIAILLKTYPMIIVPLLYLIRRKHEALWTVAWVILATIIALSVLPNMVWHDWLAGVFPTGLYGGSPIGLSSPAAIENQSLNGYFARDFSVSKWSHPLFINPILGSILTWLAAGVMTAISAIAAWRSSVISPKDCLDRMLLVALPLIYLIAPFSWEHHLVYLLPTILLLLNSRCLLHFSVRCIYYLLSLVSAVLIGLPSLAGFKFYGVLVLWGLSVLVAVRKDIELPIYGRDESPGRRKG
jgi:alpha-1,2-mannosyltransferase